MVAKTGCSPVVQATIAPAGSTQANSADAFDQKWLLLPKTLRWDGHVGSGESHSMERLSDVASPPRIRRKQVTDCTFTLKKHRETPRNQLLTGS